MAEGDGHKIVLTGVLRETLPSEVAEIAPGAEVVVCGQDEIAAHAECATVIAANRVPDVAMARADRLRWIHSWAAGPDELLSDAVRARNALVTCCRGNGAVPLAEHAMLLMLMLDRDSPRALRSQSDRRWDRFYHGELAGKTCGIIGAGNSGTDLALKAKAFHMRILGLRRTDAPAPNFDAFYPRSALHEFLAECDFVVVTAALTNETRHMLGEAEFRAMRPTARYICFSRGAIADPGALEAALREGRIAGAGLDAHAVEPLPPDSPFWDLPNVIVTPHHGALSPETRARGYGYFLENLRRFLDGAPLVNLVDTARGY